MRGPSSSRRASWVPAILFGFASLVLAEKAAEPSDDFLAYLGDLEDDDDNWSDIANGDDMKSHAHDQASSASSSSSARSASSANGRSHT